MGALGQKTQLAENGIPDKMSYTPFVHDAEGLNFCVRDKSAAAESSVLNGKWYSLGKACNLTVRRDHGNAL